MEGMLLYVHYNWSGKDIENLNENYKEAINRHFVEVRSKACHALNAKLEKWNKEFDEKYPDIVEDRYDPNSKYMKYICKKQNEVLSSIYDYLFYLRADENAEIIGDLIGTDSSVFITFTSAND